MLKLLYGLCFVAMLLSEQASWAQSADPGQTVPQQQLVDQNGIDLGTGLWAGQLAHLSIGDPANGGFDWAQPANGPDSLTALMVFGPGGDLDVSPYGFILNGNAALTQSDGNAIANPDGSCGAAQGDGVSWDTNLSVGNCMSNASSPPPAPSVGITVYYLGQSYHFYGLWDTGANPGQFVRYFELRNSHGFNSFGCYRGSDAGNYGGCIFTAHDGTVVHFPPFTYYIAPSNAPQVPGVFQATNLVKPNGEVWTYYGPSRLYGTGALVPGAGWAPSSSGKMQFGSPGKGFGALFAILQRPAAIVSNRGYTIKYLWDSVGVTDVVAYNSNQENCSLTANQCTFLHAWPSVHFSYTPYSSSTRQFVLNVKDSLGDTTSFKTDFYNGSSYPQVLTITKPSGQRRQYTLDTEYIGLGQSDIKFGGPGNIAPPDPLNTQHIISYNDGKSTWTYSYKYDYVDLHQTTGSSGYCPLCARYPLYYLNLQVTRTDPLGGERTVVSSPTGAALSDRDELGRSTTFDVVMPSQPQISDSEGLLNAVGYPSGASITLKYNNNHDPITSVREVPSTLGSDTLKTAFGYANACPYDGNVISMIRCNKPTSIVDPDGNETDYTYDPVHGGVLTETQPPDPNGVRPQVRYSYRQSTAVGQAGAIWLLASRSSCRSATSANPASCVGTATEQITRYRYDTTNLRPVSATVATGDGTSSQTTSLTYDAVGNVISATDPKGNVSYTTYDMLRRKVFEVGADPDGAEPLPRPVVHHVYDVDGNETRTETGTGFATDGSDFLLARYVQRVFDPATGRLIQTSVVVP